jgi:Fe-S-cluster-containing dehydrogenase component
MKNCPTEALGRNEEWLVFAKEEKHVRCKNCSEICVIAAIRFNPERKNPQICSFFMVEWQKSAEYRFCFLETTFGYSVLVFGLEACLFCSLDYFIRSTLKSTK